VFAINKFRSYLVCAKLIGFTDHAALKYLLTKKDAKLHLLRWILLLQEFDLEIKDKKGVENIVANHLSRMPISNMQDLPINDFLRDDMLLKVTDSKPWYETLWISWFQDTYHLEKTQRSCCTRADDTYGMIHTFTWYAPMACSEDASRKLKGSKSLRSATPHHMEATLVYFALR
jgi:hypothetical protein